MSRIEVAFGMRLPEIVIQHHVVEGQQRLADSVAQTIEKPLNPARDVEAILAGNRLQAS